MLSLRSTARASDAVRAAAGHACLPAACWLGPSWPGALSPRQTAQESGTGAHVLASRLLGGGLFRLAQLLRT